MTDETDAHRLLDYLENLINGEEYIDNPDDDIANGIVGDFIFFAHKAGFNKDEIEYLRGNEGRALRPTDTESKLTGLFLSHLMNYATEKPQWIMHRINVK